MAGSRVDEMASGHVEVYQDSPTLAVGRHLIAPVARVLAEGRPASAEELAGHLGQSTAQVAEAIDRLAAHGEVEVDSRGRVLGFGLTLIPTPHRLELEGRDHVVYTWCPPEALLFPPLLGADATIFSRCPVTEQRITIHLRSGAVEDVSPVGVVVNQPRPDELDAFNLRATSCDQSYFFASAEAAADWVATHPGGQLLTVPEAFRLGLREAHLLGAS